MSTLSTGAGVVGAETQIALPGAAGASVRPVHTPTLLEALRKHMAANGRALKATPREVALVLSRVNRGENLYGQRGSGSAWVLGLVKNEDGGMVLTDKARELIDAARVEGAT